VTEAAARSTSPFTVEDLSRDPNPLAPHYSRFRVSERILLTGHSHQAWPDASFEGPLHAWADAAELADEKWGRAEAMADCVRAGYARLLDDKPANIALGHNTHELVVRFLSALPLRERPRLVTTDGEFHSIRRQLDRIAEEGILEIVKVSAEPSTAIAERLAEAVDRRTAAVLVSSVLFRNAHIVPGLSRVMTACRTAGAELLVDAYHHLNVVPFSVKKDGLEDAFVTGGGYKYCQLGEGNGFLRVPPCRANLRPILTGWFSEFAKLTHKPGSDVPYGAGPAAWAGATYDPTSHYRAAIVFDFFAEQRLSADLLRAVSQHQVRLLAERFDALELDPRVVTRDRPVRIDQLGGFLALRTPHAGDFFRALRERGVLTDYRGDWLRLGPAPYLSDAQLESAMDHLGDVAKTLTR
jgi:kynureninase